MQRLPGGGIEFPQGKYNLMAGQRSSLLPHSRCAPTNSFGGTQPYARLWRVAEQGREKINLIYTFTKMGHSILV